MIRVTVTESAPLRCRQGAKQRMVSRELRFRATKPLNQTPQFIDVTRKLRWTSAANFLIGLRHGPDALRPCDVRVYRQQPEHRALPERTNDWDPPLAQSRATRIAQMTHHLMRSHPAPPAFASRRECLDPSQDFRPRFRMQQGRVLHGSDASMAVRIAAVMRAFMCTLRA